MTGGPAGGDFDSPGARAWRDAVLAAALFAMDPKGLKGLCVSTQAGPVRDRWLAILERFLPGDGRLRRLPLAISDDRLLGGLDLSATLAAGRPVAQRGLLAEADGGVLVAAMAERMEPATASKIAGVMDRGAVRLDRDGLAFESPSRFGLVLLDEGVEGDDAPPAALTDRLAFMLDLREVAWRDANADLFDLDALSAAVAAGRERLERASADEAIGEAICGLALAFGVASLRPPFLALRAARAAAALEGRWAANEDDASLAGRLVLVPRATRLPAPPPDEETAQDPPPPPSNEPQQDDDRTTPEPGELAEVVLEAALAALPPDLLKRLAAGLERGRGAAQAGKAGAQTRGLNRGRPIGARRGALDGGQRLHLLETLRAAAPWQPLRRREAGADDGPEERGRLHIRKDDLRVTRFKQRAGTTTIFLVDASGSAVLHRLAEVKGAVELLLADCYVRRDEVALIAFRGAGAEVLLPPTRSLVRAKRNLAQLAGGGGTPLAAGLDAGRLLAETVARKGQTPNLVLFTDGRANVARDGGQDRAQAQDDAGAAARAVKARGLKAILIDSSPRPQERARRLADDMAAAYLHLPLARAQDLSQAVQAAGRKPAPAL
jgi:magnesium chelatase subunit D